MLANCHCRSKAIQRTRQLIGTGITRYSRSYKKFSHPGATLISAAGRLYWAPCFTRLPEQKFRSRFWQGARQWCPQPGQLHLRVSPSIGKSAEKISRKAFAHFCKVRPHPENFWRHPYLKGDCWVSGRGPREAFLIALGGHAIFVLLLLAPLWNLMMTVPAPAAHQREQITWFGPVNDLPLILPPSAPVKPHTAARHPEPQLVKSPVTASQIPAPQPGADAFHPRQTIVNAPMRPNHPRQTLIQPAAPPEPPKILPSLPNIVARDASVPRLRIDPAELARLQPKILNDARGGRGRNSWKYRASHWARNASEARSVWRQRTPVF